MLTTCTDYSSNVRGVDEDIAMEDAQCSGRPTSDVDIKMGSVSNVIPIEETAPLIDKSSSDVSVPVETNAALASEVCTAKLCNALTHL